MAFPELGECHTRCLNPPMGRLHIICAMRIAHWPSDGMIQLLLQSDYLDFIKFGQQRANATFSESGQVPGIFRRIPFHFFLFIYLVANAINRNPCHARHSMELCSVILFLFQLN